MMRFGLSFATFLLVLLQVACAQYENNRGVDVTWQPASMDRLMRGKTTRGDILETLGPPSQVISLGDETVLYYLNEHAQGDGLILIAYNRFRIDTRYDRAVFFFDAADRLTDYSSWIYSDSDEAR